MPFSSSSPESGINMPSDRKRVVRELTRGREIAEQLRLTLRETGLDDAASVLPARGLLAKILESFTHCLSIICAADHLSPLLNSPAACKSEDSGHSCKTLPAPKARRGCHKRRRNSETWTKDTPTWPEDGHAWRKYGQKVILNAKHPRNYFRCTHKYDRRCPATKQVQKIQDDPPLFRTTYHGRHSCTNLLKSLSPHHHHHIREDSQDSCIIWSFQSPPLEPNSAAIEQESKPEPEKLGLIIKSSPPPNRDYFVSADQLTPAAFDAANSAHEFAAFSSGSNHGDVISSDVYSCTASTHSMDVDMMAVGSAGIEDFFDFERLA